MVRSFCAGVHVNLETALDPRFPTYTEVVDRERTEGYVAGACAVGGPVPGGHH